MKKVKIIDLPLGARFKFDLSGGVWVLLDKGLRGTCILEGCNTCSTVNVAETAEAFANMKVYSQAAYLESRKNLEPTEDTTIRHAEFDGVNLQPPTFSSGSPRVGCVIEIDHTTFQTVRKNQAVAYIKSALDELLKEAERREQAVNYIKVSLDELLKEAESFGVDVKVESTKSYVVCAK